MEAKKFGLVVFVAMALVFTFITATTYAMKYEAASVAEEPEPINDRIEVASVGAEPDPEVPSATDELDHEDYYDNMMVINGSIISTGLIRRRVDSCTTSICNMMIIPCRLGCICVPLGILSVGLCIGLCHCNFTPPAPSPHPNPNLKPPSPPQSFSPLPPP